MYHRFEENKYPSTNIKINDFVNQIKAIQKEDFYFVDAKNFEENLKNKKKTRKILLTIDDAFLSFYENAWPLLRKEKIPFILFVNTREVGKHNYMTWNQIREITNEKFVHIGNHSHSHEYLIDLTSEEIKQDIKKSILILKKEIGYNSEFFSYPFGEYSVNFKKIIREFGFKYAFGQHSGVIDETKDYFELPRFPINEKYGQIERFNFLLKTIPFNYKNIFPEEKYINSSSNPPKISIQFFENIKKLNQINCYSNEEDKWRKSKLSFKNDYNLNIILQGKFTTERGRVNCSLRDESGYWRWLGMQFVIAEN